MSPCDTFKQKNRTHVKLSDSSGDDVITTFVINSEENDPEQLRNHDRDSRFQKHSNNDSIGIVPMSVSAWNTVGDNPNFANNQNHDHGVDNQGPDKCTSPELQDFWDDVDSIGASK